MLKSGYALQNRLERLLLKSTDKNTRFKLCNIRLMGASPFELIEQKTKEILQLVINKCTFNEMDVICKLQLKEWTTPCNR